MMLVSNGWELASIYNLNNWNKMVNCLFSNSFEYWGKSGCDSSRNLFTNYTRLKIGVAFNTGCLRSSMAISSNYLK